MVKLAQHTCRGLSLSLPILCSSEWCFSLHGSSPQINCKASNSCLLTHGKVNKVSHNPRQKDWHQSILEPASRVNIVWIRYIEVYLCLNLVCFCGQMPYHLNKKTTLFFCPNVLIKMSFVTSVSQKHSFHSLVFSEGPFSLLVHKSSHVHLKVHLKIMWLLKLIQHGLGFQHSS